jgi:hypothetical protein
VRVEKDHHTETTVSSDIKIISLGITKVVRQYTEEHEATQSSKIRQRKYTSSFTSDRISGDDVQTFFEPIPVISRMTIALGSDPKGDFCRRAKRNLFPQRFS